MFAGEPFRLDAGLTSVGAVRTPPGTGGGPQGREIDGANSANSLWKESIRDGTVILVADSTQIGAGPVEQVASRGSPNERSVSRPKVLFDAWRQFDHRSLLSGRLCVTRNDQNPDVARFVASRQNDRATDDRFRTFFTPFAVFAQYQR